METNNAATPPAQTNGSNAEQGTAPNEPNAVIVDQMKQMEARFEEKNRGLYAEIRRLKEAAAQPKPQAEEPTTTVRQELEALRNDIRRERAEADKEKRESAIQSAIASHGIDSENAELLYDHVVMRFGDNIKVDGRKVVYDDPITGDQKTVKDFIGDVLKIKGDKFRPPVQTPTGRGLRTGNNSPRPLGYQDLPEADRLKLSPADALKLINAQLGGK